jgi:P27 family predicted phage terminase small subunit
MTKRGYKPKTRATVSSIAGAIRKAPAPPETLQGEACNAWRETAPILAKAGLLNAGNLPVLEAYCCALAMIRRCEAAVAKDGAFYRNGGLIKPHPAVALAAKNTASVRMLATHLGLLVPAYLGGGAPSEERADDGLGDL